MKRAALFVSLVASTGCQQLLGFESPIVIDAAGEEDVAGCGWTFTPHHGDPCGVPATTRLALIENGDYRLDTDSGTLVPPLTSEILLDGMVVGTTYVLSVDELNLGSSSRLFVTGSRGLVVFAWNTITIDGAIVIGSKQGMVGAGANPAACAENAATPGPASGTGGGGGGGGGFRGGGGNGGTGTNGNVAGGIGGLGVLVPTEIRGGCPGANAANRIGGAGGGALQLTARTSIMIGGVIDASGAGGAGGATDSGGAGGGSGGLIDLEAPAITLALTGVIAANGGGGGGGSQTGTNGSPGQDGQASGTAATGGPGSGGAAGGAGSSMTVIAGRPGVNGGDGGGGGGGGAGFVVIHVIESPMLQGLVSPQPTLD